MVSECGEFVVSTCPDIERLFEEKSIASFGIYLLSSDSQSDARSGGRACFGMHQSAVQLALRIERPICRSGVMHGFVSPTVNAARSIGHVSVVHVGSG